MPEKAIHQAFVKLVDAAPPMTQQQLEGLAENLEGGEAAIIDVPLEALPYDALRTTIANYSASDLAAERLRRQKNSRKVLANISLWDVAV